MQSLLAVTLTASSYAETKSPFGQAPSGSGSSNSSLFISYSDTVHQSRFSLSSFPLSLTAPEPEKLVFFSPPAPAPVHYSCITV